MRIYHNITSLNAFNRLDKNLNKQNKGMEKISSGLRINIAADDAAGLSISEKMRGQIRGLDQAERNVQDGIQLIHTAEGGLKEIHDSLQRIRELVIQAGNGTNTKNDREIINDEIQHLNAGIDNIANFTEFNTIPLLNRTKDGQGIGNVSIIDGSETQLTLTSNYDTRPSWIDNKIAFNRGSDIYIMDSSGANQNLLISGASQPSISYDGKFLAYVRSDGNLYYSNIDGSGEKQLTNTANVHFDPTFGSALAWAQDGKEIYFKTTNGIEKINLGSPLISSVIIAGSDVSSPSLSPDGNKIVYEKSDGIYIANIDGSDGKRLSSGSGATFSPDGTKIAFSDTSSETGDNEIYVMNVDGSDITNLTGPMSTASLHNHNIYPSWSSDGNYIAFHSDNVADPSTSGDIWSVEVSYGSTGVALHSGNNIILQVGANTNQTFGVILTDARTTSLGLDKIDVSDYTNADKSIRIVDKAIEKVSSERSKYGAYQNALEHITNNLLNYNENLNSSESRIRDVDIAKEILEQTKVSILTQASQAILAQSNQIPQGILQLLK